MMVPVRCWRSAAAIGAIGAAAAGGEVPLSAIFTGSSACRDCHPRFYELWESSHHGRAMQPVGAVLARGELTPHETPLEIPPYRYQMRLEGNRADMLEEGPEGRKTYPVLYTLGGKNVFYFLTLLDGGRLQVMPVAYDVVGRRWIDTTGSMVRHAEGLNDEALYWKERPLTFNTSCFDCHVSQMSRGYDPATDSYRTTWNEPGINCEVCHGPGAEHVRRFREAQQRGEPPPTNLFLIRMKDLTPQQRNDACSPCHAKMRPLTPQYIPGQRFWDHYDLVTWEHPDYYPDGRDLGENYTLGSWLMSPCARKGGMDCLHCHTSSGRYRFRGETANHACLPCHRERVENAAAHTHHPVGSKGNECVSCHMPMTWFAQMRRSDHSMRPPAPAATIAFGSPNACNLCHSNQTPQWADTKVREWRTRDYQAPVLALGRLVQAARSNDWSRLPAILEYLGRPDAEVMAAASLLRLLADCPDPRAAAAARQRLAIDPSPLVRAAATELLGRQRDAPPNRAALFAGCRDEARLVRIRSALALSGAVGPADPEPDRTAWSAAIAEYRASLDCRPDDWASHYNLGNLHLDQGDPRAAVAAFAAAVRIAPEQPMAWVNGAIAHARAGDLAQSEQWLRRALAIAPTNAVANFNLALAVAERGRLDEAETLLRRALASDPRMAEAAYNLGVLLGRRSPAEAIEWTARAVRFRPADPRYRWTHAFYLHRAGRIAEARAELEDLMQRRPVFPDAVILLGEIYETEGRAADARKIYELALQDPALPSDAVRTIRARLRAMR
ncbi:MAG: ammonia-forming cytochrome c nitrite reductase subunit c552 [Kiritimatiellae bacterium]|nr:ammonia-forming cytochrome c nitrite reductase subunit c552 [Kiritimatiellia bacterium]